MTLNQRNARIVQKLANKKKAEAVAKWKIWFFRNSIQIQIQIQTQQKTAQQTFLLN
jgi:hypothetical protein